MARHGISNVQKYVCRNYPADRPREDRGFGRRCRHIHTFLYVTERMGICCDNEGPTLIRPRRAMRGGDAPSDSEETRRTIGVVVPASSAWKTAACCRRSPSSHSPRIPPLAL